MESQTNTPAGPAIVPMQVAYATCGIMALFCIVVSPTGGEFGRSISFALVYMYFILLVPRLLRLYT